ncbi:MAG: hypothetical protein AB7K09_16330 [Planctomycetota bacterium]
MDWLTTPTGQLWLESAVHIAIGLALIAALFHLRGHLVKLERKLSFAMQRAGFPATSLNPDSTLADAAAGAANLLERLKRLQAVAEQLTLAAAAHYTGLESTCMEAEARGLASLARPRRSAARQTQIPFPDADLDIYDADLFNLFYPQ